MHRLGTSQRRLLVYPSEYLYGRPGRLDRSFHQLIADFGSRVARLWPRRHLSLTSADLQDQHWRLTAFSLNSITHYPLIAFQYFVTALVHQLWKDLQLLFFIPVLNISRSWTLVQGSSILSAIDSSLSFLYRTHEIFKSIFVFSDSTVPARKSGTRGVFHKAPC
jgi:hypothetical protein